MLVVVADEEDGQDEDKGEEDNCDDRAAQRITQRACGRAE